MPEPEIAETPKSASRAKKIVFKAREGLSTDFTDIVPPPEPTLGLDEALGVRWVELRGKLTGIRFGTLRERRQIEIALRTARSEPNATEDAEYQAGIQMFQAILVLADGSTGTRPMTQDEIEERVDLVDIEPLMMLAFPAVSPLQALVDAGADHPKN